MTRETENLWPKRTPINPELERAVTPGKDEIKKIVTFDLTQSQLRETLQPGAQLAFDGQARGVVTVGMIEAPKGREVINDRAYRFTGVTGNGTEVKVHIYFHEGSEIIDRANLFLKPSR